MAVTVFSLLLWLWFFSYFSLLSKSAFKKQTDKGNFFWLNTFWTIVQKKSFYFLSLIICRSPPCSLLEPTSPWEGWLEGGCCFLWRSYLCWVYWPCRCRMEKSWRKSPALFSSWFLDLKVCFHSLSEGCPSSIHLFYSWMFWPLCLLKENLVKKVKKEHQEDQEGSAREEISVCMRTGSFNTP